mgnify:FL=1
MSANLISEVTTIASALLGNAPQIQIYTQEGYLPILQNATVMEAMPKPEKDLMDSPIEKGATVTDFVVTKPKELEIALILADVNYLSDYLQIKQLYENNTFLIVQTSVDAYDNLIIKAMPHKESGEMSQAIRIMLSLREVLMVSPQYSPIPATDNNPKQAQTQSTTRQGEVQPSAPSNTQTQNSSELYNLFN